MAQVQLRSCPPHLYITTDSTSTFSTEPSVFKEWSATHGIADQMSVPTLDFSEVVNRLRDRIDLIKMDVESAEIGILESASASDLTSCVQLRLNSTIRERHSSSAMWIASVGACGLRGTGSYW